MMFRIKYVINFFYRFTLNATCLAPNSLPILLVTFFSTILILIYILKIGDDSILLCNYRICISLLFDGLIVLYSFNLLKFSQCTMLPYIFGVDIPFPPLPSLLSFPTQSYFLLLPLHFWHFLGYFLFIPLQFPLILPLLLTLFPIVLLFLLPKLTFKIFSPNLSYLVCVCPYVPIFIHNSHIILHNVR